MGISSSQATPSVTIVVVPREQFSLAQRSLTSIYTHTSYPFDLIYVDGNSPAPTRDLLKAEAQQRGFQLIRTESYLSPNQARNLAIQAVETEYIVFIDNDVIVKPGWLEALVNCGDRTGAWAVAPLTFEDTTFNTIHQFGGQIILKDLEDGRRWLIERRPYMHLSIGKVKQEFAAEQTELTEFHCVLARRDSFNITGLLDEDLLSMAEETDFCLAILKAGGSIYREPKSLVSYVPPTEMQWSDLPYFFLRWSDCWVESSINRMCEKHEIDRSSPAIKHYRGFVHKHRWFAFGGESELRFRPVLGSSLALLDKGKYCAKKMIRRRMNRKAKAYSLTV